MSNIDFADPQDPYARKQGMFDNVRTGAQGMFSGLSRGFQGGANALNPYSNRLLGFSAGMLGGGPSDAMKGLIAGSALDRESADRRKLNEAIAALQNDPDSSLLAGLSEAEQNYVAQDPAALRALIVGKFGGTTSQSPWSRLSDDTLFNEATGETRGVAGGAGGGGSFLKGNAAETQALRYLVETEQLTQDQAAQWAAGKTITGPNGEILFISPDQILNAAGMGEDGSEGPRQVTGGRMTEDQKKAKGFYERAAAADAVVGDPAISSAGQGAWDRGASSILPEGVSPYVTSTESQQFRQARDDFINANLRRESGAAISPKEYADADRIFFPQPGEPENVVKQKAAARARVIRSLQESWEPASITPGGQDDDPLELGM